MTAPTTKNRSALRLIALCALLAWQPCPAAPVYKIVGPDGKVMYTDHPPPLTAPAAREPKAAAPALVAPKSDKTPTAALASSYSKQVIVEAAARFCIQQAPATATAVLAARDGWLGRNGRISDKRNRVMQAIMSAEERNTFAINIQRESDNYLTNMRVATMAQKTLWCERVPVSFTEPDLDMSRNPALVRAIMDYPLPED